MTPACRDKEAALNRDWTRNAFVYLLIMVSLAVLFFNVPWASQAPDSIVLSDLARDIESGSVDSIDVRGADVAVKLKGGDERIIAWTGRASPCRLMTVCSNCMRMV